MSIAELEARLDRLESVAAIQRLKALAAHHVDRYEIDAFADLFVEDGVLVGAFQEHRGRQAIRENLKLWPTMIHYVMNPVIDVEGDRAKGRWCFLRPQTAPSGNHYLVGGWYDDEYVRIGGVWMFASVTISNLFCTTHAAGWGNDPVI
jgi:hypothetical protein